MANKRQKLPAQLQGHRQKPSMIELAQPAKPILPRTPKGLHPVAQRAWRDFWSSPLAQVVDMDADAEALHRWAYCVSERELLEEQIREAPLLAGSTGQMVRNPLFDILKERTREIEKFREQFGMAPLHRMRLGITYSEADEALDRMQKRRKSFEPVMIEVDDERSRHTS